MIDKIALFAETNFRNERRKFGIKIDDRRRHVYVIGKTGVGKTTVLENMAIADIRAGHGMAIVDPHGEFADKMLDFIPKSRVNDVIYFNPSDLDFPIALNVIEKVSPEQRHLVASGLVGVFKKIWADSWGPRLEYLLRNAILALLEYPNSTLLGIMRMLVDKTYRGKVIEKIQDPVVRSFWIDEFQKYPDRFLAEAVAPIQNKVGQFLTSPLVRNIVGQTKSKLNLRQVMDEGKILIMNLSKGLIGEDNSALLGAMMITRLQLAAMSRVDVPESERQDFYLYVDEFQNFATESFANILSEARKYRLDLILAHQYIAQLEEEVRDAVFGNVGTLITFRVGAEDAEFLERELMPEFTATDLVGLAKYDIYLKLMIDGMASRPFSATTLPPYPKEEKSCRETVIKLSRERYATQRDEVEMKIASWAGYGSQTLESEAIQKGKELHEAICAHCGGKALLPFKPDNRRPVYCDSCLEKIRSGELPPIPKGDRKNEVGPSSTRPELEKKITEEVKAPEAKTKEIDSAKKDKLEDIKKTGPRMTNSRLEKSEPDKSALKEALQAAMKKREEN
ncbi:MAG: CxxC-x17-CxxC domain-containing protein [Candidatus Paceibacterota bacterium]|jgi:CxxC-x17-CxxC domain-containing protein